MTVAELKAILDTLPDDAEILIHHTRLEFNRPMLFFSEDAVPSVVMIQRGTPVELPRWPMWHILPPL